ncbi:MAG: carboxypeptidase regulatory-like domain-containing protein [Candidatus Hydrogenedentes bacterium]|nr:carboxypeptidase regulatory-like domain-containing protein [Candidatus Hydrogenedentota bacterium]
MLLFLRQFFLPPDPPSKAPADPGPAAAIPKTSPGSAERSPAPAPRGSGAPGAGEALSLEAVLDALPAKRAGGASITGVVVDKRGKPLPGMKVVGAGDMFGTDIPPTTTEANGAFHIAGLAPGAFKIMALPAVSGGLGIDSGLREVTLAEGQRVTGVRLVYEGASERAVSGRVTDRRGLPISGARVEANDPTSSIMFSSHTESDGDGYFVLESREGKRFSASVFHPAYSTVHLPRIEAGTKNLNVVMEGRGAIVGRVVEDHTGNPVTRFEAGAGVRFWDATRGAENLFEDSEGRFELPSVEAGLAYVYVRADGFAPLQVRIPPLHSDETRDVGLLRMARGAALDGVVVDWTGVPVSGALVSVGGPQSHSLQPAMVRSSEVNGKACHAITDAEGRFSLESLSPVLSEIVVERAGYAQTVSPLALATDQRTAVRLVLTGFAAVEGVIRANGTPVARQHVNIEYDPAKPQLSGRTDESGYYHIEEIPAGEITVRAAINAGGGRHYVEARAETVPAHTTVVDLEALHGASAFTGTVFRAGEGVANLSVAARSLAGDEQVSGMTAAGGKFQIGGLHGGEYTIVVLDLASGEPEVLATLQAAVDEAETAVLDIDIDVHAPGAEPGW